MIDNIIDHDWNTALDILHFVHKCLLECDPIYDDELMDMSEDFGRAFCDLVDRGYIDYDDDCGMYSVSHKGMRYIEVAAGQLALPGIEVTP